ncbi:MAG: hypothetical protein IPK80_26480 [Nannocystis sp.]|nr:hypothetical protein [Nannocystis sp.]
MSTHHDIYSTLKDFIGFTDADAEHLTALAPIFAQYGAEITDGFYAQLLQREDAAALLEGQVDRLKRTHTRWMGELFAGEYGEAYFENRWKIGLAHVRVGVKPWYVEAVTSYLRAAGLTALQREVKDPELLAARAASLIKILDLDLMIINLAYGEERLDRLSSFTGMSRKLLERCVSQARAK